jgi:hypothetical protein
MVARHAIEYDLAHAHKWLGPGFSGPWPGLFFMYEAKL